MQLGEGRSIQQPFWITVGFCGTANGGAPYQGGVSAPRSNAVSCTLNGSLAHEWLWNIIYCTCGKHWFPGLGRPSGGDSFRPLVPTTTDLSRRACGPWKLMDMNFPKFISGPKTQTLSLTTNTVSCFPLSGLLILCFEKTLTNVCLNNQAGWGWRHVNMVSAETVVLLSVCWL